MPSLEELLAHCAEYHRHVCPRQVLGIRMSLLAGELLQIELPQPKKQVLAIVETDGCFSDGVAVGANCWVGRRTLRVEDYGKVAATFIDTKTESAWRIHPHPAARARAAAYSPQARNRWEAMLEGYQRMPVDELFIARPVALATPIAAIVSKAGYRVTCEACSEEVINEREVQHAGQTLCRACATGAYYHPLPAEVDAPLVSQS